jgi:hypothetical protein
MGIMGGANSPLPHGVDMPISTQCPKCQKLYRLKDELLGKRVACADKACRTLFEVVPYVPPPKPAAPRDAEAIAVAALIEEADPVQAVAEDTRKIDLTCLACDHKWQVPWAMQGKNALCPECKTRQKVPEQKAANKIDWRNPNAKRPSLAKQEEVPDDVWGSKGGTVSVGALKEAGAIKGIEYEARPVSFWIKWGMLAGVVIALSVGSVYYWYQSRKQDGQLKLIDNATADIASLKDAGLSPTAMPQFEALFQIASAEYAIRQNSPEGLKAALDRIAAARQQLQDVTGKGQDKDAVTTELISAIIAMGGTPAQANSGTRIYWSPSDIQRKPGGGMAGRDKPVVTELQDVFQILLSSGAEADWRFASLRRAVRELHAHGQGALAEGLVSSGFRSDETNEATAVAMLELARVSGDMGKAAADAETLKVLIGDKAENVPAAANALWMLVKTPGTSPPSLPASPGLNGRLAHTLLKLAQNQPAEALAVAQMPGPVDDQLRALALIAEQSAAPHDAVAAAAQHVAVPDFKTSVSNSVFVRLARAAGHTGNDATAETFVNPITDEGLKVWARADALRMKVIVNTQTKADDPLPMPDDLKKLRVGHAWAKLITFRQNQRVANRGLEQAANDLPSGTLRPFALIGLALGAQDGALR